MSAKRKHFDYNSPEVRAQVDEIIHGTFMKQGMMVAFPMGFPGATIPIVPDESHITALDVTPEGIIYGGTSGKRSHIFVAIFHGVTGMVFDMKAVDGATSCAAVCCGKTKVLACVNGPRGGGRILAAALQPLPYDLIQEWGFQRPPFEDLGECVPGELILHAVADASRERVVGITTRHLFTVDIEGGKIRVVGEISGIPRLALGSRGNILGANGQGGLWRYNPHTGALDRAAFSFPDGAWGKTHLFWGRHSQSGTLYTADANGHLFSFDEDHGFSAPLAEADLAPVGPMALTLDGRLYGFCGSEIARMFSYEPGRNEVLDLGVAVSVLERRRYGYVFGDAVTGRDGEIVFGEDDDGGHLWLYFPKTQTLKS